jgi:large subunit ribosomal protein L25
MAVPTLLRAEHRNVLGKAVRRLRRQGILPVNLTGLHMDPQALQVKASDVERLLGVHRRAMVIRLSIDPDSELYMVMISHVQREPVSRAIQHVDLRQVNMKAQMRAYIPVRLTGVAVAVASRAGILLQLVNQLEVEGLPDDLPEAIELDVRGLVSVDDALYVRDVGVSGSVTLLSEPDSLIVRVAHVRGSADETVADESPATVLTGDAPPAGADA